MDRAKNYRNNTKKAINHEKILDHTRIQGNKIKIP